MNAETPEEHQVVIVGGGQAGLAVGRELSARGLDVVIIDAHERIGDAWRNRWDSLRLFTPAKYDALPGLPYGRDRLAFPGKDDFADYLERYSAHQGLTVLTGLRVDRVWRQGDGYQLAAGRRRFAADHVVVATGGLGKPAVPPFAEELGEGIVALHSSAYRNPAQLAPGGVLVVGFGNSGSEIALEVSREHETWISGEPSGELPIRHGRAAARFVLPIVRFAGLHLLTVDTPVGRRAEPKFRSQGTPLIRVRRRELADAGVHFVPRTTGVQRGLPVVGDTALDVANVIWCTGYREDLSIVQLPGFENGARPAQYRGAVDGLPGVYLVGQEFLYSGGSDTLVGVGRDARYIARHLSRLESERRAKVGVETGSP
jgi:putative flavoprotein involved in K+ transport